MAVINSDVLMRSSSKKRALSCVDKQSFDLHNGAHGASIDDETGPKSGTQTATEL